MILAVDYMAVPQKIPFKPKYFLDLIQLQGREGVNVNLQIYHVSLPFQGRNSVFNGFFFAVLVTAANGLLCKPTISMPLIE